MSDRPVAPKYSLLVHGDGVSVLKLKVIFENAYEIHMPNVGTLQNAKFILKALQRHEDESRQAREQQKKEFDEALTKPHVFLKASTKSSECYCGEDEDAEIHIPLEAKDDGEE